MSISVDFKAKQLEFTRYVRDPDKNPAPADVKPERMEMYRELIFNNIEEFIAGNFPILRKILDDEQWYQLVQDFMVSHRCETPYFARIAEEFLAYLETERSNSADFPFLLELAHYEWVEMALAIAKDDEKVTPRQSADLLSSTIRLSPLAWPLVYEFPVQRVSPDYLPLEPPEQPTCLLAYRDQGDEVKFIEINALTFRLLEVIQDEEQITTVDCLNRVAQESNHPNPEVMINGGLQILTELVEKAVIIVCESN